MRLLGGKLSRRELALIAAALLIPVPLFAVSGLSAPLPDAIEHGLGSVVTLDAEDEPSGTTARGRGFETGNTERRQESSSLGIATRAHHAGPSATTQSGSASSESTTADTSSGNGGTNNPEADEPGGDGDAGSPGSPEGPSNPPNNPESSPGPSDSGLSATGRDRRTTVTVAGQGSAIGVSAGSDGLSIDQDADTGGSGNEGGVSVGSTDSDDSSRGVSVGIPRAGSPLP